MMYTHSIPNKQTSKLKKMEEENMKMYTACKETGNKIKQVASAKIGLDLIQKYEEEDGEEVDFYNLIWEDYTNVSSDFIEYEIMIDKAKELIGMKRYHKFESIKESLCNIYELDLISKEEYQELCELF